MPDLQTAARAERQPFDVIALCEIGRRAEHRDDGGGFGVADRKARDLGRRGQVLLEQRRRHAENVGDVVEAVAFVVRRQELGRVDLEAEQIADRVAVLGAVQAVDRRAARIRIARACAVERRGEPRDHALVDVGLGPRHALRRHRPGVELAHHPLPNFGVGGDVLEVARVEHHVADLRVLVVTGDAVLREEAFRGVGREAARRYGDGRQPAGSGGRCSCRRRCRGRRLGRAGCLAGLCTRRARNQERRNRGHGYSLQRHARGGLQM